MSDFQWWTRLRHDPAFWRASLAASTRRAPFRNSPAGLGRAPLFPGRKDCGRVPSRGLTSDGSVAGVGSCKSHRGAWEVKSFRDGRAVIPRPISPIFSAAGNDPESVGEHVPTLYAHLDDTTIE
jgi:hypothetical protein